MDEAERIETVTHIVSAYVENNRIPAGDLPGLIASVAASLDALLEPKVAQPETPQPPVPVKKTITPDHLISLEDGKPYRALKRHLSGRGMTPQEYRTKWGLPSDYPMVAPNYASARSELAKKLGLGRKAGSAGQTAATNGAADAEKPAAAKRGRKPRASKAS